MAFSHTHGRNFSSGASTITGSKTYTSGNETNVSELLPIGTNQDIVLAVDVSALVSLYIKADAACDLYVNDVSGGSPSKHIALVAEEAYMWPMGGNTNPLGSADVTIIYVTNAAETQLDIRVLQDVTP